MSHSRKCAYRVPVKLITPQSHIISDLATGCINSSRDSIITVLSNECLFTSINELLKKVVLIFFFNFTFYLLILFFHYFVEIDTQFDVNKYTHDSRIHTYVRNFFYTYIKLFLIMISILFGTPCCKKIFHIFSLLRSYISIFINIPNIFPICLFAYKPN